MTRRDAIRSIAPLFYQYPLLSKEDIPEKCGLIPISFRNKEIEGFEVLFFHRLMKRNYGEPCEVEWEKVKKLENERIVGIGTEWKYYVRTPSGGIIQIGTERYHTSLKLYHVLPEKVNEPSERLIKEGEKFVVDLLREADRLKGQILNPKKEFEKGENVQLYAIDNVFLYNYGSAELMLEYAEDYESELGYEFQKHDAYIYHNNPKKMAHVDKFLLGIGMYYGASISYYFMALEGFINLIYHAFLRDELRGQNLEERLDLGLKLLFMPALCHGFKSEFINSESEIFENFKKLKKYRNQIFHSKILDSLKSVAFVESGFMYICDMTKYTKGFFPDRKLHLHKKDVLEFKKVVDDIIKDILDRMQEQSRTLVDKYVMKEVTVPFWKDKMGKIKFGKLETKDSNNT